MKIYYIFFIFLFPKCLFAQSKPSDTLKYYNENKSIEYMSQYISLRFTQNSDIETLAVLTDNGDIHLSPNAKSTSRLSFNYKFISLSIGFIPKFISGNDDDAIKGKTKGTGYGLNLNFKHWLQQISYSGTKGYYLENTSDYRPNWTSDDPYIQFPELVYKSFEGITAYNFNPNFSVNALTTQSERQLKSAGSFIPHFIYQYYIVDDKSASSAGGATQKSKNLELLLGAGYYHTFVVKNNFYFSLGLIPGAGYVFSNLTTRFPTGNVVTKQQNAIFRLDGRSGLGYNSQRFFTGIYMKASTSTYNQEKTNVINKDSRISIQIFFGYRPNAPKWLKDKVQIANNKIRI